MVVTVQSRASQRIFMEIGGGEQKIGRSDAKKLPVVFHPALSLSITQSKLGGRSACKELDNSNLFMYLV